MTFKSLSVLCAMFILLCAQGMAADCHFCFEICNAVCSVGDGVPDGNWVCAKFTVPCDTLYQISARMDGSGTDFKACVFLYEQSNPVPIAAPHTLNCAVAKTTDGMSVRLKAGLTYRMCVGKLPCVLGRDCSHGARDEPCRAVGRVSIGRTDRCASSTCN